MHFADPCCKQWNCDVLQHHHCCGMWPCFRGWLKQCVGLSVKGWYLSELRIRRKNIIGKFVAVMNRNIYIYIFSALGKFRYLYVPEINDQLLWGNWWVQRVWCDADRSYSYVKFRNNWNCASFPSYDTLTRVRVTWICTCNRWCKWLSKSKSITVQAFTGTGGSRTIGTWRWQGCQPHALADFTHREIFLVLISGP
jgi:hypothetical protein